MSRQFCMLAMFAPQTIFSKFSSIKYKRDAHCPFSAIGFILGVWKLWDRWTNKHTMGRKIDINQQTLDITVYDDDGCGDPPKTWDNSCVKHIAYRATPNDEWWRWWWWWWWCQWWWWWWWWSQLASVAGTGDNSLVSPARPRGPHNSLPCILLKVMMMMMMATMFV